MVLSAGAHSGDGGGRAGSVHIHQQLEPGTNLLCAISATPRSAYSVSLSATVGDLHLSEGAAAGPGAQVCQLLLPYIPAAAVIVILWSLLTLGASF